MYKDKKILAVITARGGSKGVPDKNIKILMGKPLICWTIDASKKSKLLDRVILSSDSLSIIEVSKNAGCDVPFIRPKELAKDDSSSLAVLHHAIFALPEQYDYIILLQPTSPCRDEDDIDNAIMSIVDSGRPFLCSFEPVSQHPYNMVTINHMKSSVVSVLQKPENIFRRQDFPSVYISNGAIYIFEYEYLRNLESIDISDSFPFFMSSDKSIDIDTLRDFKLAEVVLNERA